MPESMGPNGLSPAPAHFWADLGLGCLLTKTPLSQRRQRVREGVGFGAEADGAVWAWDTQGHALEPRASAEFATAAFLAQWGTYA